MKQIFTSDISAKPRSRYYAYYNDSVPSSGSQPISSGNGNQFISNPAIITGDTYANLVALPNPSPDSIYITLDTNDMYRWDDDSNQWINLGSTNSVVYSAGTPTGTGEPNKYYIDTTNKIGYFWNGSQFVQMAGGSGGFSGVQNTSTLDTFVTMPRVAVNTRETSLAASGSNVVLREMYKFLQPGNNVSFDESTPGYVTISALGGNSGITSINSATGAAITLAAGNYIDSITRSGNTITINASQQGGGGTAGVSSLNGATGNLTIAPGSNITVERIGSTITISATDTKGITSVNNQYGDSNGALAIQGSDGNIDVQSNGNIITLGLNEANMVDGTTNVVTNNKIATNRIPAAVMTTNGAGFNKQELHLVCGNIRFTGNLSDNQTYSYDMPSELNYSNSFGWQCDFMQDYKPGSVNYVSPEFYHTSIDSASGNNPISIRLTSSFNGSEYYAGYLTFSFYTTLNLHSVFQQ